MFAYARQQDRLLLNLLMWHSEEMLADPARADQIVSASLEEARALAALLPD